MMERLRLLYLQSLGKNYNPSEKVPWGVVSKRWHTLASNVTPTFPISKAPLVFQTQVSFLLDNYIRKRVFDPDNYSIARVTAQYSSLSSEAVNETLKSNLGNNSDLLTRINQIFNIKPCPTMNMDGTVIKQQKEDAVSV